MAVIHRSSGARGAATVDAVTIVHAVLVLRIFIGAILAVVLAISMVPLLVLLDLVGGGDGWGLCPAGLGSCRTSYFDGLELAVFLSVALFILLAVLRLAWQLYRRMERQQERSTGTRV